MLLYRAKPPQTNLPYQIITWAPEIATHRSVCRVGVRAVHPISHPATPLTDALHYLQSQIATTSDQCSRQSGSDRGLDRGDQVEAHKPHPEALRHQWHHQRPLDCRPASTQQAQHATRSQRRAYHLSPEGSYLVGPDVAAAAAFALCFNEVVVVGVVVGNRAKRPHRWCWCPPPESS